MWVVEKFHISVEKTNLLLPVAEYSFKIGDIMFRERFPSNKVKRVALCPNIITPDTIPEFCIPPKISTPSQLELKSVESARLTPSITISCSERSSPKKEIISKELVSTHIIQVETVDDGPTTNPAVMKKTPMQILRARLHFLCPTWQKPRHVMASAHFWRAPTPEGRSLCSTMIPIRVDFL